MAAASIRVRGVTYRSPDEARVAAEEIRHRGDELAGELRRNGRDGTADELQDRAHADAERLLEWARTSEEADAASTAQPADTPRPTRSSSSSRRTSSRARSKPARARPSRAGRAARRAGSDLFAGGYRRSGARGALVSTGNLGWQIVGWTIGAAALALVVTPRGSDAFASLTGLAGSFLRLIVDPVDPLAKGALAAPVAPAPAPAPRAPAVTPRAAGVPARRTAVMH